MEYKIGQKVKIIKRVDKQLGWLNDWTVEMDSFIGDIVTITSLDDGYGYKIDETWEQFPSSCFSPVQEQLMLFEL